MRDFRVFTQPSIADPSHFIAVSERVNGDLCKNFSDVQPLLDAAMEVERARAKAVGFNEGIEYALKLFGISKQEFQSRLKESK